jgi:Ion channel
MTAVSPARRTSRNGGEGPPGFPDAHVRSGLLLLVLIASYLLSAFSLSKIADVINMVLFLVALLLALRTSRLSGRRAIVLVAVTVTGTLAAQAADLTGADTGIGLSYIWRTLLLLLAAVLIVRRVLARPTVTIQSIYGALSAYLIIGLMFAALYSAIDHLTGTPFFVNGEAGNTQTFQYFSFTTLTTLGYGDFTAAGNGGRAIAVMEALVGQIFLATLVARLVAAFRAPAEEHRVAGIVPPVRLARRRGPAGKAAIMTPQAGRRPRRRPGSGGRQPGPARDQPEPGSRPPPRR